MPVNLLTFHFTSCSGPELGAMEPGRQQREPQAHPGARPAVGKERPVCAQPAKGNWRMKLIRKLFGSAPTCQTDEALCPR